MPQVYDPLPFEVDHIIATQHQGPTREDNLAIACYACNHHKGPNVAGFDIVTRQVVPLFHPRREGWTEHFRWNGPELQGLTPVGRVTVHVLAINRDFRVALDVRWSRKACFLRTAGRRRPHKITANQPPPLPRERANWPRVAAPLACTSALSGCSPASTQIARTTEYGRIDHRATTPRTASFPASRRMPWMESAVRRVVITGLGVICPLGNTKEALWEALLAGRSGVTARRQALPGAATRPPAGDAGSFTGEIDDFGPLEKEQKKAIRKGLKVMCRECQMGVAAAHGALADARLTPARLDPERTGISSAPTTCSPCPRSFTTAFASASTSERPVPVLPLGDRGHAARCRRCGC